VRIICYVTLVLFLLFNSAWGKPADCEKECTAYVHGQTAEFIFSLPEKQLWTWNKKETPDNLLEYTWNISLVGNDSKGTYDFGIYLFKYPNSEEVTGSIVDLISYAQTSAWDQGNRRDDLIIKSTIQDHKLIIRVTDKKTFSKLFHQKPTIAHCRVRTPYPELDCAGNAQIDFTK
jgi:hypothetical protein